MNIIKDFDFTGRTIVITGGTGVLCSEMARALVALGANVGILARNPEKGAKVVSGIDGPGTAFMVKGDVLDKSSLIEASEKVIARFGRIDGLVNGAERGVIRCGRSCESISCGCLQKHGTRRACSRTR